MEAPSSDGDKIMHAYLETPDGLTPMASDTPAGMEGSSGTRITVSLSGDDADLLRGYWEKLTDGAEVTMPLERQVWATTTASHRQVRDPVDAQHHGCRPGVTSAPASRSPPGEDG